MDLQSRAHWVEFSRAKDEMFVYTDIPEARWWVVEGDNKRRARLNCIHHLLSVVPYEDVLETPLELPPRPAESDYKRPPRDLFRYVPRWSGRAPSRTRTCRSRFERILLRSTLSLGAAPTHGTQISDPPA